jgi:hypothetical protein
MKKFVIAACLMVAVTASDFADAATALVTEDWRSPGDGLILYDPSTNLQWLNLSVTQGQSYNAVVSQLGTTYAGFSVASLDQVTQFFSDAGITPLDVVVNGTNPAVDLLLRSWGITSPIPADQQNATFAFTSNTSPSFPGSNNIAFLEEWGTDPAIGQVAGWVAATPNSNFDYDSVAYSIIGTALVRPKPKPLFAGTPGSPNCTGASVSALSNQYGNNLGAAATALGFTSVKALQNAISGFCAG